MARQTLTAIAEQRLIQDIQEFIPLFHRQPTPLEVLDWAQDIYHCSVHGSHSMTHRWAKHLIMMANNPEPGT